MISPPSSILGGFFRSFINLTWVDSFTRGFHGSLDGIAELLTTKIVSYMPAARSADTRIFRISVSSLGQQVLQQIKEAYPCQYQLHHNFCLLFVIKPESWENLSEVLENTVQELTTATEDLQNYTDLITNVQRILVAVSKLKMRSAYLSRAIKENNLDIERIRQNSYYQEIKRISKGIKEAIDDLLERMFSPSAAANAMKHFLALRQYWESYEHDLYQFRRWADIDLLAKNSLVIKYAMTINDKTISAEDALHKVKTMVNGLLTQTHCHSIFILGVTKESKCAVLKASFYLSNSSSFSLRSLLKSSQSSHYTPSLPSTQGPVLSSSQLLHRASISPRCSTTAVSSIPPLPLPNSLISKSKPDSPSSELTSSSQLPPSHDASSSGSALTGTSLRSSGAQSLSALMTESKGRKKKEHGLTSIEMARSIRIAVQTAVDDFNLALPDLPLYDPAPGDEYFSSSSSSHT